MSYLLKQSTVEEEYQLFARLLGSAGPINCLAFTEDGKFLASGGDDEKLRIWDINAKRPHQVIGDELERWGQVTCTKWLPGISNNGEVLCFGTGRGLVLIYQWLKEANSFKELSNTSVLPFNEPVESMDYDKNKSRLALSSHTGKIKVFHLEKNGTLISLWSKNWNDTQECKGVIPRCVQFTDKGENIVIFGLESGTMMSKAAATGADIWTKTLKSNVGNVCFSADQKWMLIDNLTKGFDLYIYPRSSPSDSFPIAHDKTFIQQGVFLEDEASVVCGSDHGEIHIFSLGTSKCLQKLRHGSRKTRIQVLDACSTANRHLIASGTDESKPGIYIWEKKHSVKGHHEQLRSYGCNSMTVLILLNIFLIIFFALLGLSGNGGQKWFNRQSLTQAIQRPSTRGPSAAQSPRNAKPLLEQNGIYLNEPEWSDVIYL